MSSNPSLLGRTLGEFVVREELGEGGFGKVYLAYQPSLDREVVVKVLHDHLGTEEGAQRFLREARLASRLEHRNAAHLYAFGREPEGTLWIAMERVRGTPFNRYLAQSGPMPLTRFLPILEQLCEVVAAAHAAGIVHRDIKPSNVMIEARGGKLAAKLLDFGIAKLLSAEGGPGASSTLLAIDDELVSTPAERAELAAISQTLTAPLSDPTAAIEPTELARPGAAGGDATETAGIGELATVRAVTSQGAAASDQRSDAGASPSSEVWATRLTQAGIVGSPPYMAPEQWTPGASIDGRADVYALGILAFEALSGARPYVRRGLPGYAYAHMKQPIPDLPEAMPRAVNEVVKRALAKDPGDRFQTAADLARAFRTAVGGGVEPDELPALDEAISDRFASAAPQPIAETVSALVAARNAHQARDAARDIVAVLVRYLGAVALASYGRVRPPEQPRLGALLRALRQGPLQEQQWVELAARACAPFAECPDVHPVVELVRLFTSSDVAALRETVGRFADTDTSGSSGGAPRGSEAEVVGWLEARIPDLERLLDSVSFICDYPLVVPGELDASTAALWMGLPRRARRELPLTRATPAGQPILASEDGEPLLTLSPLVCVEPPSPGASDEIFLLSGPGSRGARLTTAVGGFTFETEAPWDWLREQFLAGEGDATSDESESRAPYRGLTAFTEADAEFFFGRDRIAQSFLNRLREQQLLALAGPSGAGKSSFLRAGVVPRLADDWSAVFVRPGSAPTAALCARLEAEGWAGAGELDPSSDPETLAAAIGRSARDSGNTLLLVIDQGEELFTLCGDVVERRAYAALLAAAAGRGAADDSIRVVIAIRDDFLVRLQQLPPLRDPLIHGVQLLGVPDRDDLLDILIEPARRAGYEFDDPDLAVEMVDEVEGEPGALALLEFTAAKLWEQRDQQFRRLTRAAYDAMGGVAGALARHADDVVDAMSSSRREVVRRLFGYLVTSDGTRAVVSRSELRERLGDDGETDAVLDRLLAARLLASAETSTDEVDRVEIIHETLIEAWPRLVEWRREDAEGARLRDQLRAAVRQWEARDRPRGLLWRDDALTEYKLWRKRYPWVLTSAEQEFAEASLAAAERGRRLKRTVVAVVIVALAGFSIALALASWREARARSDAEEQRVVAEMSAAEARRLLATQYLSEGRRRLLGESPAKALVYLDAARELGTDSAELDFLLAEAARPLRAQESANRGHSAKIWALDVAPDGTMFATSGEDGVVVLWDAATGTPTRRLTGHDGTVSSVRFDAAGRRLVSAGFDRTARIWSSAGELIRVIRLSSIGLDAHLVNADRVVTLTDQKATVWRIEDGAQLAELAELGGPTMLAPSQTGSFAVIGTMSGRAHVWRYGEEPAQVIGDGSAAIVSARVSSDGTTVATGAWDGSVQIWSATNGRAIQSFRGHTERISSMAFDRSGRFLVTASRDRTARLWDLEAGVQRHSFVHEGFAADAAFSPDGTLVLTSAGDGVARLWDSESGASIASFDGHAAPVWRATFSTDGQRVVTASWDGFLRTFRIADARRSVVFRGHGARVGVAAPLEGGTRVLSAGADGFARVWDSNTGAEIAALPTGGEVDELVVRGERALLSGANLGHAVLLDAAGTAAPQRFSSPGQSIVKAVLAGPTWVATGSKQGRVTLWNPETGQSVAHRDHGEVITALAYDEARKQLAVATAAGRLLLLGLPALDVAGEVEAHSNEIWRVRYSADGSRIATASLDGSAALWRPEGPALVARLPHDGAVIKVRFDRAGERVATASEDTTTGVWDAEDGRRLGTLRGSGNHVFDVAFDPTGALIATSGDGGSAIIWGARSFEPLAELEGHLDPVVSARFDATGTSLATAGWDGTAVAWTTELRAPPDAELDRLLRCASPWAVDRDGRLRVATLAADGCIESR